MTTEPRRKPRYKYIRFYRLDTKQIFVHPEPGVITPMSADRWIVQSACGAFLVDPLGRGLGLSLLAMHGA